MIILPGPNPTVARSALPAARAPLGLGSIGFGIQAGLGAAGDVIGALGAKEKAEKEKAQRKADDLTFLQESSDFRRRRLDLTSGETGVLRHTGPDLLQRAEKTRVDVERDLSEVLDRFQSPELRQRWQEFGIKETSRLDLELDAHIAETRVAAVPAARDEALALSLAEVAASVEANGVMMMDNGRVVTDFAKDPALNGLAVIEGFTEQYGHLAPGGAKAYAEEAPRQFLSQMHTRVIDTLVARGDLEEARAWLEQHEKQIAPASRATITGKLRDVDTDARIARTSEAAFRETYRPEDALSEGSGLSIAEMEDEAIAIITRSLEDPKERDTAIRRVKSQYADVRRLLHEQRHDVQEELARDINNGADIFDLQRRDEWRQLSVAQQDALIDRHQGLNSPRAIVTDQRLRAELEDISIARPEAFDTTDLLELHHAGKLDKATYEKLRKLQLDQRRAQKGDPEAAAAVKLYVSGEEAANNVFDRTVGTSGGRDKNEEKASRGTMLIALDEARVIFHETHGRDMNVDEVQAEAERIAARTIITDDGYIWNSTVDAVDFNARDIFVSGLDSGSDDTDTVLISQDEYLKMVHTFSDQVKRAPRTEDEIRRFIAVQLRAGRFTPQSFDT